MQQRQVLTVSELMSRARRLLEGEFGLIWLEGEISNFSSPGSGHWYFSLKDSQAQVRCALFRNRNQLLSYRPKDGDKVLIRARVSLYEPRGDFQLIGEYLEPAGFGALQQQFEMLKQKLQAEGLFDEERKKPLPAFVQTLGVITSPTGAALHDVLSVLKKRAPQVRVIIYPAMVQGKEAAQTLIDALATANRRNEVDVLLLTRGGGSLEDLWSFNDEALARAITESRLPIVSAVGHEVDFTIADFVADQRAPTPSAGAALLSTDQQTMALQIGHITQQLQRKLQQLLQHKRQQLAHLQARLRAPEFLLQRHQQRVDELSQRLQRASLQHIAQRRERLQRWQSMLQQLSPRQRLLQRREKLDQLQQRLHQHYRQQLQQRRVQLKNLVQQLNQISPLATLARGYTLTRVAETGVYLRDASRLSVGTRIETLTSSHQIDSQVVTITPRKS